MLYISGLYICEFCRKKFCQRFLLLRHQRIYHHGNTYSRKRKNITSHFECPLCDEEYDNISSFKQHIKFCNATCYYIRCKCCGKRSMSEKLMKKHTVKCYEQIGYGETNRLPKLQKGSVFNLSKFSFKGFLQQYELFPEKKFVDVDNFFLYYKNNILELVESILTVIKSVKLKFIIQVTFVKQVGDLQIFTIGYFPTDSIIITETETFEQSFQNIISDLEEKVQNFENVGSGWRVFEIDRLDIRVGSYKPLSGGCNHVLPKTLIFKKALLNIKSPDQKCFLWAVLSQIFPFKTNPQRYS